MGIGYYSKRAEQLALSSVPSLLYQTYNSLPFKLGVPIADYSVRQYTVIDSDTVKHYTFTANYQPFRQIVPYPIMRTPNA